MINTTDQYFNLDELELSLTINLLYFKYSRKDDS